MTTHKYFAVRIDALENNNYEDTQFCIAKDLEDLKEHFTADHTPKKGESMWMWYAPNEGSFHSYFGGRILRVEDSSALHEKLEARFEEQKIAIIGRGGNMYREIDGLYGDTDNCWHGVPYRNPEAFRLDVESTVRGFGGGNFIAGRVKVTGISMLMPA